MTKKKATTRAKMTIKREVKKGVKNAAKRMSPAAKVFIAFLLILVIVGAGAYYYFFVYKKNENNKVVSGQFSVHFLELGNDNSGDCVYIKAGETDIIVDAGSKTNSISTISSYVDNYVKDGKFEYAIVTHAHEDHFACFAGDNKNSNLFEKYSFGTIIDFPKTNSGTNMYQRYTANRDSEVENDGAVHYTALQCWNQTDGAKREYTLADGITLQILYNYYYENNSSTENDYSVCFMINQGSNHYLFTGDLEKKGEKYLTQYNTLPKVTLFKAGHHGSNTSNSDDLLSVITPQYIAITCVAGSTEYSKQLENTFPYQEVCNRIAKYTDNVFVTTCIDIRLKDDGSGKYENYGDAHSLNGTIIFACDDGKISFTGSANSTKLKDSEWFKAYRTMPAEWAA